MTQEDKELLLKDLYARLFSGIIVHHRNTDKDYRLICVFPDGRIGVTSLELGIPLTPTSVNECRPYLRPMSSMTGDEWIEWCDMSIDDEKERVFVGGGKRFVPTTNRTDWLNEHHFDYRGLITMGLALEAPEAMYK